MHRNHLADHLLPFEHGGTPVHGRGFALGSSVLTDTDTAGGNGSVGEHGWPGAATTLFWVDPQLQLTITAQSIMRLHDTEVDPKATIHHTIATPTTI